MITVANAPCSYGAFEITVGIDPLVPPALALLDHVAEAGYAGIDLGPLGYLGIGEELAERLRSRNLTLAGGYFAVPFSDPSQLPSELERLDLLLDTFDAASSGSDGGAGTPKPRPTIADAGSESRSAYPGRAVEDRSLGWDDDGWRRFADQLAQIVARCRERGYEPTFHPHTATYVEAPWEIDRLLELSRHRRLPRHRAPAARWRRPGECGRQLARADQPPAPQGRPARRHPGDHPGLGAGGGDLAASRVLPARGRRCRT